MHLRLRFRSLSPLRVVYAKVKGQGDEIFFIFTLKEKEIMTFIKTETLESVFKITLNRPDKFNCFNRDMALQMQDALDHASADASIRAIYITGEGKAFCAGQDLGEAIDSSGPGIEKIVREHYNPIILKIRNIEKPVVCAVNGVAAGAGANIALACDVVVAGNSVSFIQAFSKIGLIPDSGGTFFLPRLIGFGKASALMMLGDKVSAADAEKMGMIYKVVDDINLQPEALTIAKTLSDLPTIGIGLTKRLLNQSMTNSLEQQLMNEGDLQVKAASSYDYKEGVNAFLEKRKPVFIGE
jgi:2-(1,2-epoxy-1,2-dihydrophenyl)acetyl-CoA isomerase